MSRPRLTVRARLTLLYTGLFAVCGALVVAVGYAQVARLPAQVQGKAGTPSPGDLAGFAARCRSAEPSVRPDARVLAKCAAYFQQQGAQGQRDLTLSHLLQYSLITLAVVIALAAVLGWIFAGRALRPVHRITAAARAASEHNLSARVAATGPRDELRELAETFDEMLGRLQAAFEGQQRFIANASHELRTPLAVMRATVDVVLDDPDSTPGDLRGMARGHPRRGRPRRAPDRRAADPGAERARAHRPRGGRPGRGGRGRARHRRPGRPAGARRAGARRHLGRSGAGRTAGREPGRQRAPVQPAGRRHLVSTGTVAGGSELTVANTGPVVDPADAGRIFQPFQRLSDRTSHDGFGLGLAIVASIAAIHGGTAAARPRDDGGLSVTVTIPTEPR